MNLFVITYQRKRCLGNPTLGANLGQRILAMRTGCTGAAPRGPAAGLEHEFVALFGSIWAVTFNSYPCPCPRQVVEQTCRTKWAQQEVCRTFGGRGVGMNITARNTPSPPTKSFPIKSPWVELFGRLPMKLYGHENSHPLELRVCLSQTLWNPNS